MTNSGHFLFVWALWLRPEHARYLTMRTDFALSQLGSRQVLGYQESTFPFSIVQNLAILNRPLGVLLDMNNFEHFLFVLAQWMRPKHRWYSTVKMNFRSIFNVYRLFGYHNSGFPFCIIQDLAISNRLIYVVHDMTNFARSLLVSAEWMRSKDGRSFTARSDFHSFDCNLTCV